MVAARKMCMYRANSIEGQKFARIPRETAVPGIYVRTKYGATEYTYSTVYSVRTELGRIRPVYIPVCKSSFSDHVAPARSNFGPV